MKLNKRTATIISFALGTVMFTTTAIAQVISKSGYDQLKDSLKYTAENCTTKLSSYTADMSFVIKDNSTVILSDNTVSKVDVANDAKENISTKLQGSTKSESYNYNDKNGYINKNSDQNIYYTSEYTSPRENVVSTNPFKEKQASDMEKIADALVGNLKDAVVVKENTDGSKTLSGSLTETQIPALINAVVSLQSKNEFSNRGNNNGMPMITNDVVVKEVKGNMVTTKEGFIQSVLGSGVISGKDEKGIEHKLTFELLAKISNTNSTKVNKPDLTGKKVEKNIEQDYSKLTNPEKYVGLYKTEILVDKGAKFEKIGERFIDVTAVDTKGISGRYYEVYTKGFEEYATNKKDFKFNAKFDPNNKMNATFNAGGSTNNSMNISLNPGSGKIYFSTNDRPTKNMLFDDQFSRVFK